MKIKFLAWPAAPASYEFEGDAITAHLNGGSELYDLSDFPESGVFGSADRINNVPAILDIKRVDGILHVTLPQQVIAGKYPKKEAKWRGLDWIDAVDYDPEKCYVTPTGMGGVEDYEIVRGVDVAGVEGWTVRKKEVVENG